MSVRRYKITVKGREYDVEVGELTSSPVTVRVDGVAYQVELPDKEQTAPAAPAPAATASSPQPAPSPAPAAAPPRPSVPVNNGDGTIRAVMPGRIVRVNVAAGDSVTAGQAVLVMESMKMENTIAATKDGTVRAVLVSEGDSVQHGQTLVEVV